MPEVTVPQPAPAASPASPPGRPKPKFNKRKVRQAVIAGAVVVALAAGGFLLYRFLTKQDSASSEIQTQAVQYGTIQSKVTGSGNAKAKESAAITLTAGGTVQEVFVSPGDTVTAGQPLYTIFSQEAQDQVTQAQTQVDNLNKEMSALLEDANNLTVRAPFAGKLINVKEFQPDQEVAKETAVATLVNDKKLKLSLYFSYAYENQIRTGQSVQVSIPTVMGTYTGTVEKINKVRFISPEGAVHFEAVIAFQNPGTLTAGMDASATLTASDGSAIYPYENGKTEYYETREIVTKAAGPVVSQGNLMDYADVSAGEALLTLGSSTIDETIMSKQKEIDEAQKKLADAQKGLADFNAVSPIDGSVTSCTLTPGTEVKSGDTVVTISNTTNMVVDITVDDRNIAFVQPGLTVELSDWNGNTFIGTVTAINMGAAESQNGMTNYPVTLTVDNQDGSLLAGMYLDYSFVASQSDDCMMVPMQSVKNIPGEDGSTDSVVFIRADKRPENAVDLEIPEPEPGQPPMYPSPEDGFYPVKVETGLNDDYNVEIKSGLNGDEEVFVNYLVESAYG
ncbi:HlyD family efflux transporter periplasmic adaptor subunit [Pseudoflavonifractor capillosus]|uniref:HlyD family efflux transporter periplasmic adaptor subunit n=1 Tax=Pseudoflavonifractor capillosus TaxID=106588 RepID=UPI001959D290|nr:HlyD family efflux transporter periplasmic adaptor subunit [Pseudoflavonifractor capillosus]MBM6681365.1 HlyD family efflux transporter periplasmic adaptor subunit [Pseudoflavonifractor capillosus]